jgi:hypothetical protein
VTEEGAEAIGLAVATSRGIWRVRRRLQARLAEGADWLMVDASTGATIVLEIGGTDEEALASILARKIRQARCSPFSERGTPAACVVRFLEPSVALVVDDGPGRTE